MFQHWRQVRQRVGVDVSDGGIVLIAGQAPGSVVHLAGSEQFEHLLLRVHGVRARAQSGDVVDDEVGGKER